MFSILKCFLLLCFCLPTTGSQESVDFEKQILPIFRQHCFDCHGDGNTEGELSLQSIAMIRQGGHTGSSMLSSELGDSELYLRITSKSDGYRMPKKGDPLPQRDVETIGKWIQQVSKGIQAGLIETSGAQINPADSASREVDAGASFNSGDGPKTPSLIDGMEPMQIATFAIAAVVVLLLIVWFLYKLTVMAGKRKFTGNTRRTSVFVAMLLGVVSSIALAALGYFYRRTGELVKENEALRVELRASNPHVAPTIEISQTNLEMPPHPMHPPRLGGRYYRGNDERDPQLFNGGFYRTATIDLNLIDSTGKRVEWGSDAKDDLSVEIRIQRAPNSTKELFSQRVHDALSLRHYCQTVPELNGMMKFEIVEPEELWVVKVPLPKIDQWESQRAEGMIYMMYGVQPGPKRAPRPHFAIRYDLRNGDGTISDESQLWMGSLYTLGNRVLVPDKKMILLDRWFDWRPIPVIEGKGSTDPKLLGTDEHLGDQ